MDSDTTESRLVSDYLDRLTVAGAGLAPERRNELVAEVREHIEAALRAERGAGSHGEADVRNVLDRLGPPEEIVAAALDDEPPKQVAATPGPVPSGTGLRDVWTVLLLTCGGFFVGLGWLIGVVLLWTSPRWRTRDKWLATLVWPFGYAGVFIVVGGGAIFTSSVQTCTSTAVTAGGAAAETCTSTGFSLPGWAGFLVFVAIILGPVLVSIRLLRAPTVGPPHTLSG